MIQSDQAISKARKSPQNHPACSNPSAKNTLLIINLFHACNVYTTYPLIKSHGEAGANPERPQIRGMVHPE